MLAIPSGLVIGNADNLPDALRLAKDDVHLFERTVGRFRVEEVDCWEDERSVTILTSVSWYSMYG